MSIPLVINGTTYDYPEVDDVDWGPDATDWAAGVTNGMLQKAGGLFQLLAEVDFGTAYGVKSLYFKTRTANPADAGPFRLAKTDVINWRNNANDGNLSLGISGTDVLQFDGSDIQGAITVSDTATIDLTFSSNVLSADIIALSIDNSMISNSAAIAYSKLALTGSIVNADLANMAQSTFKGRAASSGTGAPVDLTATQATAILNNLVGDSGSGGTKGLAPAPASGDAALNKFLKADGTWTTPPGAGDVVGPASATDNAVARFNLTTGKLIQNSGVIIGDTNNVSGVNDLAVLGNLNVDVLTASQVVVTDSSKNLASLAYASANTALAIVQRDGSGDFSAGTITASLSGNATSATNVATTQVSSNASFFPLMVASSTNGNQAADLGTGLTFNPSSNALTTTTFVGAVTGTASGNTTYSANNHGVVISSATNAMTVIAPDSSTVKTLISGGASADPAWGVLALGGGGTGATTKAGAFDALSPMTTGGDIIYGGASGTGTRLANGSSGQVLTSAGSTSAPTWTQPGTINVTNQTTTYSVLATDGLILCSGSAFTATLPTAASITGRTYKFKKTDSSLANIITIATTSAQTIDGLSSFTLNTLNDEVTVTSDGSNWQITGREVPSVFVTYTPTFTGLGTVANTNFYWRRVGDSVEIMGYVTSGTVTANALAITLPSGATSDNTGKIASGVYQIVGNFVNTNSGTMLYPICTNNATTFGYSYLGQAFSPVLANTQFTNGSSLTCRVTIPINGWKG